MDKDSSGLNFLFGFPIKLGLLWVVILCFSSFVSAEDYKWSGPQYLWYSTPAAACKAEADISTEISKIRDGSDYFVYWPKAQIRVGGDNYFAFDCYFSRETLSGAWHSEWILIWTTYRSGDACVAGAIFNSDNGECNQATVEKGVEETSSCAAIPVNIASGNLFESVVDAEVSNTGLGLTRYYNSADGVWSHSYSTRLNISDGNPVLVTGTGKELKYTVSGGSVSAQSTDFGKLSKVSNGWSYFSVKNERFNFDESGRLVQKTSSTGQRQQLVYSGNSITVTDQAGQALVITEDAQHQPLTLSAPGVSIQYSYNANQRLIQVTRDRGGLSESRQYHYEDTRNNRLLTGVTDELGQRSTTWTYDDQGRATSSQHFGGVELTQLTYNADGTRKVTNEFGKSTLYRFVDVAGVKRVSAVEGEPSANCPASNSTFTYNSRGQVLTQTDAKGFITTHAYNERGLETSRTEASGTPQARTITTTWHATFNLPLTVTEPGQQTTYTYDVQGRQTSRTQTAL